MRLMPVALVTVIAAGTMASAGFGQRPDDQVDARSVTIARQAQAALTAGRTDEATDLPRLAKPFGQAELAEALAAEAGGPSNVVRLPIRSRSSGPGDTGRD